MSKYTQLTQYLSKRFSDPETSEITLTVAEIEKLVEKGLPKGSAKAGWWANVASNGSTPLPHVNAWNDAGCFVYEASPQKPVKSVCFHRGRSNQGNAFSKAKPGPEGSPIPLTISWTWTELGKLSRGTQSQHTNAKHELIFPEPSKSPAIYCFRCVINSTHHVYVGETDNLYRRLQQYRSATGSTEKHVESMLHQALNEGNEPTLLVAQIADASLGTDSWQIELSSAFNRVLLEHAAIAHEQRAGRQVINR